MQNDKLTPLDALVAQLESMAARYRRKAQQQRQTAVVNGIEAEILADRLSCAQSLRAGCLPETGALNNVRPDTEEARYAPFN